MHEVTGSIPASSTPHPLQFVWIAAATLAGFVAGEGSFYRVRLPAYRDGTDRQRFVFAVAVASRDRHLLVALRSFVGGAVFDRPSRRDGWQPMSELRVGSRTTHRARTIPFFNQFLLRGNKRRQFEVWRDELQQYDDLNPRRRARSICRVAGCADFVRGRGLCRRHYYRETGY